MNDDTEGFSRDEYEKSSINLQSLRRILPEDSFASLAREVLLRVASHPVLSSSESENPPAEEIDALANALISKEKNAGSDFVLALRAEGVPVEVVYLSYLAAAARTLGVWWEEDRVDLFDVTVGSGRIYGIMRAMAPLFDAPRMLDRQAAMFSAIPGDSHTLGIRMAADLFRKRGWEIDLKVDQSFQDLITAFQKSGHMLVGLSGGGQHAIPELARLAVALKIVNPKAKIIVSGNVANCDREILALTGVDACEADFDAAATELQRLWDTLEADVTPRKLT